ncbi:MAG: hypothetical protein AAF806_16915 [Bacteroidota bacterium]
MDKKIVTEIFWWIITGIITLAILFPMISAGKYEFTWPNAILVAAFVTITRYMFLLKNTFLSPLQYVKAAMILLAPIIAFLLIGEINKFQTFLDEYGWEAVISNEAAVKKEGLSKYIYSEMLFFGVGSVIGAFLLPIRMVVSIWRVRNLGRE